MTSPTTCGADPLTQTQSAGIASLPAASGSTVTGNTVTGNDVGIYNFADGPTTISGNTLTDNRFEGIVLDEGDATVDSNTIDPGNVGILVVSFADEHGRLERDAHLQRDHRGHGGRHPPAHRSPERIHGGPDRDTTTASRATRWGSTIRPRCHRRRDPELVGLPPRVQETPAATR